MSLLQPLILLLAILEIFAEAADCFLLRGFQKSLPSGLLDFSLCQTGGILLNLGFALHQTYLVMMGSLRVLLPKFSQFGDLVSEIDLSCEKCSAF